MRRWGRALAGAAMAVSAAPWVAPAAPAHAATDTASLPSPAYWMATDNGGIISFGGVRLYGAATGLGAPVIGMTSTADGRGYWMAAANGAVGALGDAANLGDAHALPLAQPIVGIAATADGGGFYLVARDGGIFTYGDARFFGSTGAIRLNQPIVGMSVTPSGDGYRLVAADGGIFTFGDARFFGSTGAIRLNQPIVGMDGTPDGDGYWLVARDGGIFTFGDAPFFGSTGAIRLNSPIAAMERVPGGTGYWLVARDGGIFTFGDAPFRGSAGGSPMLHPVVDMAEGPGYGTGEVATANEGLGPYPSGSSGYDISWPQCGGAYPGGHQIGIVGVNDGHAFSTNPCLTSEANWGGAAHGLYMNLNSPNGSTYQQGATGPAGTCASSDAGCWGYNYGFNNAVYSMSVVDQAGVTSQQWWLDVETGNYWSGDTGANSRVVQGAVDALHSRGFTVGAYSTPYQWGVITGGFAPGIPVWVATGLSSPDFGTWCTSAHSFGGGQVWLVQYGAGNYDGDYAC